MSRAFLAAQTVLLVVLSLGLLYPVVAHAQNVMHTRAVVLLAASLLVFTGSSVVEQFVAIPALAEGLHALADLAVAAALWLFAREFIRIDGDRESVADVAFHVAGVDDDHEPAGFENATDEPETRFAEQSFDRSTGGDDGE